MVGGLRSQCVSFCLAGLLSLALAAPALAQRAEAQEAVWGEPFGVGMVSVRLGERFDFRPDWRNFELTEKNGRAFYPVFSERRRVLAAEPRDRVRILRAYFLFRGNEPLELQLRVAGGETFRWMIRPTADRLVRNRSAHRDGLQTWWALYAEAASKRMEVDALPAALDNYLVAMLASRLELSRPVPRKRGLLQRDLHLALAPMVESEPLRLAFQRESFSDGAQRREPADQPLPPAVPRPAADSPEDPGDVKIEPIAQRVPAECFYLHCGSYTNLRRLQAKADEWGRLFRGLAPAAGFDDGRAGRFESQLALYEPAVPALVVETLIADAAIIGADPFFHDGAAFGVLFQAHNSELLSAQFQLNRRRARTADPDAVEETVRIAGRDVRLLATPDNRLRSFYAADGDFHLVTTSRQLVQRFLETANGGNSLGQLAEFRRARRLIPAGGKDSMLLYLSEPFQRQLAGPQYRVELRRRAQAAGDIELVHLARLAAKAEGRPADSVSALIEGRFLPAAFETRPDGGRAVLHEDGTVHDSLRGGWRTFLPIPDLEIEHVTRTEAGQYDEFARLYRSKWQQMDPIAVGVTLRPGRDRDHERLTFDVRVTPYSRQRLSFLAQLVAPADQRQLAPVSGDLATVEGRLSGMLAPPDRPGPGRVFAGLRDFKPSFRIRDGQVKPGLLFFNELRGYFGADRPYSWLPGDPAFADEQGYVPPEGILPWGFWSRHVPGLHVASLHRDVLAAVPPELKFEDAQRPAQLRLRLADWSQSQLVRLPDAYAYARAYSASAGNSWFLHRLIEQLKVDPQQAQEAAERIVHAKLVCPLGGTYELNEENVQFAHWRSTAWRKSLFDVSDVPDWFRTPLFERLRSLELEFNMDAAQLAARIDVEMRKSATK